ncbi:MAG: UDP-N-acetylmuramate--L-alanine ligase [Firmicutes bacterium HGW-Firmicutes-15]|nr:MAG: UDP-N-acetylmuramate--L-alanine ligase [Firmicutes bacterium HGW-Firmicutes-15]
MTTTSAQWVHMVGIAGAGMSGIAKVLREKGVRVSGSDLQINGITSNLEKIGVQVYEGHSSSNLKEGVDLLVISSAIPTDNVEVQVAKAQNIPVLKRGQMLAAMANAHKGLAVAGAHGKTTTTSMLYTVLAGCGLDPTLIVGGEIQGTQLNARLGKNEYFVVEADESDASFLELRPYVAIVTNIENDHLDFYKSLERIQDAFCQFLNQVSPDGFVLLYGGDNSIQTIKGDLSSRILFYGEDSSFDYYLENWKPCGMGCTFDVYHQKEYLGQIGLSIPGKHNALNALAAMAVAIELGQDFNHLKSALKGFPGAKRRFQVMATVAGMTIVDDYAHHPTEIKATIEATRQFHRGRLMVVFQPHRYSRTSLLADEFGESFREADLVIITDIYAAGEKPLVGVSGELVYKAAHNAGANVLYIPTVDRIEDYLLGELRENDLLITMGAGDIWKLGVRLAERLSALNPTA